LVDHSATGWGRIRVLFGNRIGRRFDPDRYGQARVRVAACAAAAALGFHVVAARAQQETPVLDQYLPPSTAGGGSQFQPDIAEITRVLSEYESPGVTLSNVVIRPELNESVGYDSNPAGLATPKGSALIETQASVSASLDEPISSFRLGASVDNATYPTLPNQSYTNWSFSAGAEHQFGLDDLTANYSHQLSNILPSGLNSASIQQPLSMSLDDGQLAYRVALGPGFVTPAVQVDRFDFEDVPIAGTDFTQAINNRIVVSPSVTFGYELATRRDVVLVVKNSTASYTETAPGLANRNYNDFAALTGLDYDADAVIRFRALIGYEIRTFSSDEFKTIQAPIFEASAIWAVTRLTSITGTVSRKIEAALDNTTTGYTETYGQLRVDHQFLPNLLLYARGGYYYDQYQDLGNQSLASVGVGGNWLLNRRMQLGASYDFVSRTTGSGSSESALGPSYVDNRFLVTLRLRL
jgi:hypothetical protein